MRVRVTTDALKFVGAYYWSHVDIWLNGGIVACTDVKFIDGVAYES